MKKIIFLSISFFSFTGCFGLFDNGSDKVVDDYRVTWIDLHENRSLDKQAELIPAYVFAVGHNARFIYAKQHPLKVGSTDKIDKAITNFYIIERTQNSYQDKPVYGPLTESGFDSLCRILRLSSEDLVFDMTYPTNLY